MSRRYWYAKRNPINACLYGQPCCPLSPKWAELAYSLVTAGRLQRLGLGKDDEQHTWLTSREFRGKYDAPSTRATTKHAVFTEGHVVAGMRRSHLRR